MASLIEGVPWSQVALAAVVFSVGLILGFLARRLVRRALLKFMPYRLVSGLEKLLLYTILAITVVTILGIFKVDLSGFIVAGGVAGIAVGLACQTLLSNLLAGVFLYLDNPLKVGDTVEVEGVGGVVSGISMLSTRITTWDGVQVRIPNEKLFTATIRNYSRSVARRLELVVGIGCSEDTRRAIGIIRGVLEEHPLVLVEPPPQVYVDELAPDSINIRILAWTPAAEWFNARKQLLDSVRRALAEAGVEMPFPQRDVWFRSPLRIEATLRTGDQQQPPTP